MQDLSDHTKAVEKLASLIKDIKVAMLTTVDSEGNLRSRPMATQDEPFDGTLWFFTKAPSGKTDELGHDSRVNLSYAEPKDQSYVSISGRAQVVRDRKKAEELWKPLYKAWFPKGLDDPDLALLRVEAESAEYWDTPSGTVVHVFGFIKALATGQSYEPGEHEKVKL